MTKIKRLKADERERLLATLRARFKDNRDRHPKLDWAQVETKLAASPAKLGSLYEMERTGGEPDVVVVDQLDQIMFIDCSPESPVGRRSVCYDRAGWESRKEHRPATSALEMAHAMGIALLTEAQYRQLQQFGKFDSKTSSWLDTPPAIRELGGAIFGDFRFGQVFVYHNGPQSYYAGRAFRGCLRI